MTEQLTQIAERLKKVREENDLDIQWAAIALGVSENELLSYESGEEDIPVSFLYMAAKKYGVELSTLLTGINPNQHLYTLVRKDEGVRVERSTAYEYQSLCADFIHKRIEPMLVTVEPKQSANHSYNHHPGQEFHYCLEGRLKVTIANEEMILNPGDSLMFNSDHPHSLEAMDGKTAKFLAVII